MKKVINSILKTVNLKLIKASSSHGYISAKETVKHAKLAGLSVCDYVENEWNQVGETQKVINNMDQYGVFKKSNPTICEIGAGTGRYMEKVILKCKPIRYESYETATDWADWLQNEYPIISQPTSGTSLQSTPDESVDILHAHGVFVYIPFFDSLRYFKEIDRVLHKNSTLVFDCLTEDCLEDNHLNKWINSEHNFPRVLPEKYVLDYFPNTNYNLLGTFFTPYGQGKSKYFVFKKN